MIKIGAVVTTSGPAARLVKSFIKTIQLVKVELKDTTHQYELLIEEIASPEKMEPTRLELVTSAMRRRRHSVVVVHRCSKIPRKQAYSLLEVIMDVRCCSPGLVSNWCQLTANLLVP